MNTGNKALLDKSLLKFMENNKPAQKQKNKLDAFSQQIFFLKDNGYSDNQIVEFLRTEKQLNTTQQAVNQFIHKHRENSTQNNTQIKSKRKTKAIAATDTPSPKPVINEKTNSSTFTFGNIPLSDLYE